MNLAEARIAFRPRTLAETFDLALRWVPSAGGTLYLKLGALTLAPAAVGCYLLAALADLHWAWVWLVALGLATVLQGVFTVAASRLMFDRDVGVGGVLRHFFSHFAAYLGGLIVTRLIHVLGALTILGFPFFWAYAAFVHEAALLEGHGTLTAVKRGGAFTARQYGNVILMGFGQLIALLTFVAAADAIGAALFEFVLQLGRPFGDLWSDGGSATALFGFFGAIPFITAVRFLMYIDGRTRRDGWDIQLAFLAVAMADDRARREAAA